MHVFSGHCCILEHINQWKYAFCLLPLSYFSLFLSLLFLSLSYFFLSLFLSLCLISFSISFLSPSLSLSRYLYHFVLCAQLLGLPTCIPQRREKRRGCISFSPERSWALGERHRNSFLHKIKELEAKEVVCVLQLPCVRGCNVLHVCLELLDCGEIHSELNVCFVQPSI